MASNIIPRAPSKPLLKPPQDHDIFYYFLDFNRVRFYYVDKFEARCCSVTPYDAMIYLSRCPEYQFYYAHTREVHHLFADGKGYITSNLIIGEEMISRNEFFSQYALGTLEGVFIATRDREYLREYLTCHKHY